MRLKLFSSVSLYDECETYELQMSKYYIAKAFWPQTKQGSYGPFSPYCL